MPMCRTVYRYQSGWEAFQATLKAQVEKQAQTNATKAAALDGGTKRRRLNRNIPDVSVAVDLSDDAPSLVSQ